ncbi:MAG: hypothetical protein JWO56_1835 [Acidobacteria bacterium]|nr:hypothetical protein [Acidobacteriota bacterium]
MNLSPDLRQAIDDARARVRFSYPAWLRPFLMRDVVGITLGRGIYLSPRMLDRPREEVERLVRHELAHVRQVARLGLLRFLWRYAAEWIRNRRKGMPAAQAYSEISFEIEATAAEEHV